MSQPAGVLEDTSGLQNAICRHAIYSLGRPWQGLSSYNRFVAVALAVRDQMIDRLLESEVRYRRKDAKRMYYLSIEFLIGRSLGANLRNLGMYESCREALHCLGTDLQELEEVEPDAALGNGGLGRLAACFLDSLATLGMPGFGYGINYEFGLFKQEIENGQQRELPDNWLLLGSPWQIPQPQRACLVPIYGRIEHGLDRHGSYNPMWLDWKVIVGLPHDMLIPGYGGQTVNFLRLYSARASRDFDMRIFNDGDYFKAVEQKIHSEMISKVLYPSDAVIAGQELRLAQEYFLVACAIRDIVRRFQADHADFHQFPDKVAIQLNDTHPTLAIVELMRTLVDEKDLPWEDSWEITQKTFGYTNHTLSAEALEKWPVSLLDRVLPRHLQIIQEINRRFLDEVTLRTPNGFGRAARLSILEKTGQEQVRMVNLAVLGSHSVNGVSPIHTNLLRTVLLKDFYWLSPERFNNKTNGISPRRWLLHANPLLSALISERIGTGWITDLNELRKLETLASDEDFQREFSQVKRRNKERLSSFLEDHLRVKLDTTSLFDMHVKRIHGYKRQLLKLLHIMYEYLALVEDGKQPIVPRTYVFSGKAAPGYWLAKQVIKLIHDVGDVINNDARAKNLMKVVFVPDYRVSLAELIIPATDLGEQISTAGKEASGTGNMKKSLNGAIMIGTYDGANLDIRDEVGEENMFLFGMKADEVWQLQQSLTYRPREICDRYPLIKRLVDSLATGVFSFGSSDFSAWLSRRLLSVEDDQFHLADLPSYLSAQEEAGLAFCDKNRWTRMSILNVARIGKFSSDRAISEYAAEIWNIESS